MEPALPSGFKDLEPFVQYWAAEETQERRARRERLSMDEIRAFYDPMLAKAEAAIAHLEGKALDRLEGADLRLMQLLLALAHASMSVEVHRQARAPNTPYPHKVTLVEGPTLFG